MFLYVLLTADLPIAIFFFYFQGDAKSELNLNEVQDIKFISKHNLQSLLGTIWW